MSRGSRLERREERIAEREAALRQQELSDQLRAAEKKEQTEAEAKALLNLSVEELTLMAAVELIKSKKHMLYDGEIMHNTRSIALSNLAILSAMNGGATDMQTQ